MTNDKFVITGSNNKTTLLTKGERYKK